MNRDSEKRSSGSKDQPTQDSRPPRLAELSDSGMIEYDADVIALLHRARTGPESDQAHLAIAKQGDGQTGKVELVWNGRYCRFENPPVHPCQPSERPMPEGERPGTVARRQELARTINFQSPICN